MVTFLITSLFILGLIALALYFWQKPAAPSDTEFLPIPPERRSLFADASSKDTPELENTAFSQAQRDEVLARANEGMNSALLEAKHSGDAALYDEVLIALAAMAEGPKLLSLVSYVARNELPINKALAEKFIASWKSAPTRNSTAEMIHIAALSDDARTYQTAVETVLQYWRDGKLAEVYATELKSIIDGEFWILSSDSRSSGAGFVLKQTMANARRELESASHEEQHS